MRKVYIFIFIFLGGCSALELPVSIGIGGDKLKKSPCACLEIEQQWDDISLIGEEIFNV